jgi:hypothetical protein
MHGIVTQTQENMMRSTFALAVSLLIGSPAATLAAAKHPAPTPTYEACQALAVERALPPNQGPSTTFDAPYKLFMRECLAGKIPFDDRTAPVARGSL